MKRVKHFLLASCLFPTLLGAQEMASAYFLELTPDAQSAGMAGTGLATTDNGTTAIFHNASTIAFSQEVMGASYSYAKINQDYALHSASLFYRIGREGIHGFAVGFRHFKDPKVLDYRPHAWDLEAAYSLPSCKAGRQDFRYPDNGQECPMPCFQTADVTADGFPTLS